MASCVDCGLNEIDHRNGGSTLINSAVLIGTDGRLLSRRRKLMPTNSERTVWGMGDASGLRVVDTPVGRIGVLTRWELYMPLARFALYAQNREILVAPTWDCGDGWQASLHHVAREGGCWVLSLATALHARNIPDDYPQRDKRSSADEWICDGGAVVVAPFGDWVACPLHRRQEVLYVAIDPARAAQAQRSFDVAGHHARPDISQLTVNRAEMPPVAFVF